MRIIKIVCSLAVGACLLTATGCGGSATEDPAARQAASAEETRPVDPAEGGASQTQQPGGSEGQDGGQPSGPSANSTDPVAVAVEWLAEASGQPASKLSGRISTTARSGEEFWVRVLVSQAGYETEGVLLSQKVEGGEWTRRSYGTGTTSEDLVSRYGLSPEAAWELMRR